MKVAVFSNTCGKLQGRQEQGFVSEEWELYCGACQRGLVKEEGERLWGQQDHCLSPLRAASCWQISHLHSSPLVHSSLRDKWQILKGKYINLAYIVILLQTEQLIEQFRIAFLHVFCLNLSTEISVQKTEFKRFYQRLKIASFIDKKYLN